MQVKPKNLSAKMNVILINLEVNMGMNVSSILIMAEQFFSFI